MIDVLPCQAQYLCLKCSAKWFARPGKQTCRCGSIFVKWMDHVLTRKYGG